MKNSTKKSISLSILGVSLVVAVGTAAGIGLNMTHYDEYNVCHNIYNESQKSSTHSLHMSLKDYIKKYNKLVAPLTKDQISEQKQVRKTTLNSFNNGSATFQNEVAKEYGLSLKDCKSLLISFSELNFIEADEISFFASFITMLIFVVIVLSSGIAYTRINAGINHKRKKSQY